MPAPIPETIANDLIDRLKGYAIDNPPTEFEYRLLHAEADKLKSVSADEGWMITGMIHSLEGKLDECKSAFEKSLRLPSVERNVTIANYSKALRILGRFDEALDIVEKYMDEASPDLLRQALEVAYAQGLLDKAIMYAEQYNHLGSTEGFGIMTRFADFCDDLEIDRNELHELTMLVSQTLYSKKKFAQNTVPLLDPETGDSLLVLFHVDADAQTLSDIEWDIAMQMDNHNFPSIEAGKLMPIIKSVH